MFLMEDGKIFWKDIICTLDIVFFARHLPLSAVKDSTPFGMP